MKQKRLKIRCVLVIFCVLSLFLTAGCGKKEETVTAENVRTVSVAGFRDTERAKNISLSSDGLEVCRIGTYSGTFVEQGTDTACENIPAVIVHNTTGQMLEKAVLTRGTQTFIVTYLPPDGICLVQECSGSEATKEDEDCPLAFSGSVEFVQEPSMQENLIKITPGEQTVTMENISGEDIPGSVNVWYKVKQNGLFIGGVSYKAAVDDGVLYAGASATVHTVHFDPAKTEILLVTLSNG